VKAVAKGDIKGTKKNPNTEIIEQKKFGVTMPLTPGSESNYPQNTRTKK
jgi:hypothetical protein